MKDIGDKVADVGVGVEGVSNKVEDIDEKVKTVDEKVQVVIEDGKQVRVAAQETSLVLQQAANDMDEIKWNQFIQLLRSWLSPADPSTNHNIARKARHNGTAAWLFQGQIIKWKSIGSLLWIHGKPGSGKSVICSSVIQDIMAVCETGSAIMAYFYFDFKDLKKQTCHDLLLSLVSQLSTRSSPCCGILHRVYESHDKGSRQPSDETLKECLKQMLRLSGQRPIFIVLDALDECPDSFGLPPPRSEVLQLVKELVDLRLRGLFICATSRPEVDIHAVLEPLAFRSLSLQDESGQKSDIADYICTVVNSSPSTAMRRWRTDDKNMVIETLTERADGMFRWVFCQLDALQHCFPPNLRQYLNELPETLDETYERILKGINKAQKDNAHRLLQCLTVAVRPLLVEELAELLAFDFQATTSGGVPTLKEDWRWDDQEEAVLSTCSSLIIIIPRDYSRVVQFSHFSVKEFLTSSRLTQSPHGEVSRFHIDLEPAHARLIMKYPEQVNARGALNLFPLPAALSKRHFRVANILYTHGAVVDVQGFCEDTPLRAASCSGQADVMRWLLNHGADTNAIGFFGFTPLSGAAHGMHLEAVQVLLEHNADINLPSKDGETPLYWIVSHCSSKEKFVEMMRRLLEHGADPNICNNIHKKTPLHKASSHGLLEAARLLLSYGAKVDQKDKKGRTPFQRAASKGYEEMTKLLLEHGAVPQL
ncbi:Ankyrin repeat-containing domain protein [Lactarius tabidus]